MEASDGSPPQSLCMIRAAELFPKSQMEKEDTQLSVPLQELSGESVKYLGRTDDGVLALTNYRIFLLKASNNSETSVPLGLIESVQNRDLFHLIVNCKDASTVKCSFETAEQCSEWQRRLQMSVGVPETMESLFAFPFCSWTCDSATAAAAAAGGAPTQNGVSGSGPGPSLLDNPSCFSACSFPDYSERLQRVHRSRNDDDFMREVERLGFDLNGAWRISLANVDFKLCPSYPQRMLVPCCIPDETLHMVANFRGSRRLPAVVWRHRKSGAVIARCSQPEVGWLGWRNAKDEQFLKALADACAFDRGEQMRRLNQGRTSGNESESGGVGVGAGMNGGVVGSSQMLSGESSPCSPDGSHEEVALDEVRKILIVDARSYTSAVTNRARGGGCECIEYYPCAEIEFMNLSNIHVIRKSFHALRQLCASPADVPNWLGMLEKTMWLQHLSGLLAASMTVCHAVEKKGRPVLVHCSDGWDRTPQIVATAQLCLDPYYRTVEGFRLLVEREWLSYGHKFADRCGHGPGSDEVNERCPVFLQWLDIVHQIHKQFPCSFEFSMAYLIKLAQHSHSCLFGTFLCNTLKERLENSVYERTFSVWPFLSGPIYRNPLYVPNKHEVLWPAYNVRDLYFWTEVYLGSLGGNQTSTDFPSSSNLDGLNGSMSPMAKTRSYGDLITAGIIQNGISRRSSDPNMAVDPSLTLGSNSENNSIADIQSEREDSPDIIITNLIHDTTRKLQNLTIELNNHDDAFKYTYKQQSQKQQEQDQQEEKPSIGIDNGDREEDEIDDEVEIGSGGEGDGGVDYCPSSVEDYEETLMKLLQKQQQPPPQPNVNPSDTSTAAMVHTYGGGGGGGIGIGVGGSSFFTAAASPSTQINNLNSIGCEKSSNRILSETTTTTPTPTPTYASITRNTFVTPRSTTTDPPLINNTNITTTNIATTATTTNGFTNGNRLSIDRYDDRRKSGTVNGNAIVEQLNGGITIEKASDIHLDLMQSVDLGSPGGMGMGSLSSSGHQHEQSMWHGSVNTSTDTLVPVVDGRRQSFNSTKRSDENFDDDEDDNGGRETTATGDCVDGGINGTMNAFERLSKEQLKSSGNFGSITSITANSYNHCSAINNVNNSILPRVHSRPSVLSKSSSNASVSSSSSSLNRLGNGNGTGNGSESRTADVGSDADVDAAPVAHIDPMDESILILPEHQKLEISLSGKCDAMYNVSLQQQQQQQQNQQQYQQPSNIPSNIGNGSTPMYPYGINNFMTAGAGAGAGAGSAAAGWTINQRRRRTSSSNSRRDGISLRQMNNGGSSTMSRFSLTGVRSLPMTPPGLPERPPQIAISCPDGLAHALSEQNIRLQQIVHEHKLREDVLLREIHDMRMALLKKICPNCNNATATATNDEQCSVLDNVENASICSWEAVEDRSGPPSSCTSSSTQPTNNAKSVLWVPDHAVSRCTSCQIEFWLGRRKHHCRSCGQIFCADCSEFWAPLPDEKLFTPVRLCGPCYHTITMSQLQNNAALMQYQQSVAMRTAASVNGTANANANANATAATATATATVNVSAAAITAAAAAAATATNAAANVTTLTPAAATSKA